MAKGKPVSRKEVLQRMMELAVGNANDAVKLAYLSEEQWEDIGGLNLGCLTEFKRNANGTVEVKLADRAAVLEKLLDQLKEEAGGPAAFLSALEQPAEPSGEPRTGEGGCRKENRPEARASPRSSGES